MVLPQMTMEKTFDNQQPQILLGLNLVKIIFVVRNKFTKKQKMLLKAWTFFLLNIFLLQAHLFLNHSLHP
jgi:hypothetical protein